MTEDPGFFGQLKSFFPELEIFLKEAGLGILGALAVVSIFAVGLWWIAPVSS
jgi:hypothetical protein